MKRHLINAKTLTKGMLCSLLLLAQTGFSQSIPDTVSEKVTTLSDRLDGIGERLSTAEGDLAKLTRIKISGYIQGQWEWSQDRSVYPSNSFSVRRARVKIQYEPVTGVAFVVQPDFLASGVTMKDAYVQVNEPWLKTFSLWVGQFNRPNYEVEYSSGQREVPERSRVVKALYPGERAIGLKLEAAPGALPLKFQLAVLNGNDNLVIKDAAGTDINVKNKDFDNFKDLMGRLTYQLKLGSFGSLDLGANGYLGFLKATNDTVLDSKYQVDRTIAIGKPLHRNWFGAKLRFYADVLGGLALKSEFMMGQNASASIPNIEREFMGYYVYLIKNAGRRNQFALRWDYYDPNTKLGGKEIGSSTGTYKSGLDDLAYSDLTVAWNYYFSDNIRFQLAYDYPINEKADISKSYTVNGEKVINDYNEVFPQSTVTARVQVKF